MYVLECGEYDEVLRWSKNGKSFVVVDSKHFERNVLPALFKTSKFDSFVRKLSRWGFAKRSGTGSRNGSTPTPIWFCHPSFQKGKFSLCSTAVLCNSKVDVEASLALLNKADCEDDDKFNDKTAMQFLAASSGRSMNAMNGMPSLSGAQGASGVVPSSSAGLMSAGGFALPQMLGNSGMRIMQQQFQGLPIMQNNGMLMTQLSGQNNMSNMGYDNNNMNSMASLNNNVAYLLMQQNPQNQQGLLSGGFQNNHNQMNNFNDHQYGNRNQSQSTQEMSQRQGMQQPSNGSVGNGNNMNNMNFSSVSSNQGPIQQDNRMQAPSSGNLNTSASLDVMENVQQQLLELERQRQELMSKAGMTNTRRFTNEE